MKPLLLFIALYASGIKAQTALQFDKRPVECEGKWIAFPIDEDSYYCYGFVYIDAENGLMLDYRGSFKIKGNTFIPRNPDSTVTQYPLQPDEAKVAIIPTNKLKDLKVPASPVWLQKYQADSGSIERLMRWGSLYNSWREYAKALTFLEQAKNVNPNYPFLNYELAIAYNGCGKYDRAISLLESTIANEPTNCYLYKELAFAQMHSGLLEKAAATCKKGIALCTDNGIKRQIAYNITYQYYKVRNKEEFKIWADETKKWVTSSNQYTDVLNGMENDMENQVGFSR